jgi:hypothetical protein
VRWPTSLAIIVAPPRASTVLAGWAGDAYIHSVIVTTLTLAHARGEDERVPNLRPVLLDEARKLVAVLQGGEVPAGTSIKH